MLAPRKESYQIRSDQSLSRVQLFATPWITARQASLSITNSRSSPRLMSIESVMPSSHLILFVPFSSCPQSLPASESFPMSQLFVWGGQSTGVSALASFLPKKSQGWFTIYLPFIELRASYELSRLKVTTILWSAYHYFNLTYEWFMLSIYEPM